MTNRNSKLAAAAAITLMLAGVSSQAAETDSNAAWTSGGSVGIVESGDVNLRLGMASLTPGMADGTTILRYNISATDGLVAQLRHSQALQLDVLHRDGGSHARVQVFVKRASMIASRVSTLCAFDSDDYAVEDAGSFRLHTESAPELESQPLEFDFQNNVYYLEVWLTKDGSGIGPAFGGAMIKVAGK
jgi:hypothetical protein